MGISALTSGSITDVSFALPSLNEIFAVLFLQAGFNSTLVIVGTTFLGIAAGVVGSFALLRKRALMGDALAHSTLPGLAFAYMVSIYFGFEGRNFIFLLLGATISGVLGVLCVQLLSKLTRLPEDSSIGAVLSVFFGLGVVLLSIIQSMHSSGSAGLNHFIYGQTAAMRTFDAYLITGAAVLATLTAFFLIKEFSLVSFDPEFAIVQGWPINFIDLIMMVLVTIVTVIGLQSVGIILIISLLIIPAAAARFWTEKLSLMVFLSAFIGGVSGYAGAAASTLLPRSPAGAVIVLMSGIIFTVSFFLAPKRGVLSGALRLGKLKLRIFKDHLLRDIYETFEKKNTEFDFYLPLKEVPYLRAMSALRIAITVTFLKWFDIINTKGNTFTLTDKGLRRSKKLVRNHRLWEQYIFEFAEVSPTHVDYSADFAEHVLSPEIMEKLESRLTAVEAKATKSLHPLEGNKP